MNPLVVFTVFAAIAGLIVGIGGLPDLSLWGDSGASAVPEPMQNMSHQHRNRPAPIARHYATNKAPDFSLPDQNGVIHTLAEAKGKWAVLAFYPMDDSSACTEENKTFTAQKDEFAPLNAVAYTISTQSVESKRTFSQHAALSHTMLSDVGGKVVEQYGAYMGSASMASRVTFYISPDGKIAAVDDNISIMTAARDALEKLKMLQENSMKKGNSPHK